VTKEERFSFFSGHASHTFAFASYASGLAFSQLKDDSSAWFYTGLLFGSASWIGASRAIDKQHNWSDVLAGAAVGSAIGYLTFNRVTQVSEYPVQIEATLTKITATVQLD
jgi:membrane-associated phospholipid phosphatase